MIIQIDKLKRRPRRIEIDERVADFPVLSELVEQEAVVFEDAIRGSLTATWAGSIIEVAGSLETTVTTACARCLKPTTSQLALQVLLCYSELVVDQEPAAEDLEIRNEELGLIAYSGTEIDLRPDLEQEIVMALPQHLLCQESCKGLCAVCGIDLNLGHCTCDPPVFHAGLAALKNLRLE